MMDWGSGWGVVGWLGMGVMVAIWVVPIVLVVWLVVRSSQTDQSSSQISAPKSAKSDPDEVLAERFARGEVDEEEFYRRREFLSSVAKGPS